ncbi:unnamed protein product, partial [Meganyctiphanes norvegica]
EACRSHNCGINGECYWDDTRKKVSCMCKASYYKDASSKQCYKCLDDEHCSDGEACRSHACQNVCDSGCAQDASCTAQNHKKTCTCRSSLVGNPYPNRSNSGCYDCVVDDDCSIDKYCSNNHCNSIEPTCKVTKQQLLCTCPEGYQITEQTICEHLITTSSIQPVTTSSIQPLTIGMITGFCFIILANILCVCLYFRKKICTGNNLQREGGQPIEIQENQTRPTQDHHYEDPEALGTVQENLHRPTYDHVYEDPEALGPVQGGIPEFYEGENNYLYPIEGTNAS